MNDIELFKILGPLAFRAADKFFKFISWAIIISVVGYARDVTGSGPMTWVFNLGIMVFAFPLLMQSMYLFVRDPAEWKITPAYQTFSRVIQVIGGVFLLFVCSAPFLYLDAIIADLKAAKIHEIVLPAQ